MKETEGIFDDSVIFVTTQGSVIGIDGGRITVAKKGEGELASFPIGKVDTINVFGGVNFTTPFVASANEHGIVLNLTFKRLSDIPHNFYCYRLHLLHNY